MPYSGTVELCSTYLTWNDAVVDAGILEYRNAFVAGRWVDGPDRFPVENPADESVVVELFATPLDEVHRAIAEARRSFDEGVWADLPPSERAQVPARIARPPRDAP